MNAKQRQIIDAAGLDASEFAVTAEGWSHNGYLAWQLETCDKSKRVMTDDTRIAAVLRQLDDAE